MKNIIKNSFTFFLSFMLLCSSCETLELDLVQNPNRIPINQADPQALLNSLYRPYIEFIERVGEVGGEVTRINAMVGGEDRNGIYASIYSNDPFLRSDLISDNDLETAWNEFYASSLPEMELIENIAANSEGSPYNFHLAIVKILKAHMASVLVDYFGDIVYSEATNLLSFSAPRLDDDQDVYQICFKLLDEAVTLLKAGPTSANLDDRFYNGDETKWIKLANSLKLRMYKNTGNTAAFNAIIDGGEFINSSADDFQDANDGGLTGERFLAKFIEDWSRPTNVEFKSNWLMQKMVDLNDPRIRYYFYKSTDNVTTAPCIGLTPPAHYAGFTYCTVGNGYHGRSHGSIINTALADGDDDDETQATRYGVYPYGGRFDDDRYSTGTIDLTTGAAGKGVVPILLASDIDFWRGQMASGAANKASFLRAGMVKSIAKVQSFGAKDSGADLSFEPDALSVSTYIDGVVNDFMTSNGDRQENIFAEQYFISMYGNSIEAYNYYRKTGFPETLAPSWNVSPGAFPRSFLYPAIETETNESVREVDKKFTDQVFWDTNPVSPTFPFSN